MIVNKYYHFTFYFFYDIIIYIWKKEKIVISKINNKNIKISEFYCVNCGNKSYPIVRLTSKEREPGHLKKMFCLYCQAEENMVEIKSNGKYTLEDFKIEYKGGNFINGNRVKPYKQFITEYKNKQKNGVGIYE